MKIGFTAAALGLLFAAPAFTSLLAQQPAAADGDQPAVVTPPADRHPNPPTVVCAGDQLTVSAKNSTLGSILAELRRCGGVDVDLPPAASAARVYDEIGPAPARQVLETLLGATGFDFVLSASSAQPDKIDSILVMDRAATSPTASDDGHNASPSRRAFQQMRDAAKPKSPEVQAELAEGVHSSTSAGLAPQQPVVPAPNSDASKPSAGSAGMTSAPATGTATETIAAANPPAPTTAAPTQNPSHSATEDQIMNMQQMFERRKQINQSQPPQ